MRRIHSRLFSSRLFSSRLLLPRLFSPRLFLLGAAILFASCSLALAQAPGTLPGDAAVPCPPYPDARMHWDAAPIVDAIDTNRDGILTHEEWRAAGAPEESWNAFMSKDKAHKGYITRAEFLADTPPPGIDFNCDGKITLDEFHRFAANAPARRPPPAAN